MDGKTIYSISLKIDMASSWQQLPAIEKKEKVVADVSWWEERVQEPHVLLLSAERPCTSPEMASSGQQLPVLDIARAAPQAATAPAPPPPGAAKRATWLPPFLAHSRYRRSLVFGALYAVDLQCFHRVESMELRSQRFIRLMLPKHGSCGNGFIEKARRWPVVDLDPCPSCLQISY